MKKKLILKFVLLFSVWVVLFISSVGTTSIKAIAVKAGMTGSEVMSESSSDSEDGGADRLPLTVTSFNTATVNQAPIMNLNSSTNFVVSGLPVNIANSDATISDVDSNISSLTAVFTPLDSTNEILFLNGEATNAAMGLSVTYNSSNGTLSITGEASPSTYQAILRGILYENRSVTSDIQPGRRTIEVTVNDGVSNTTGVSYVDVVTAPIIDLNGGNPGYDTEASFTEGGAAVLITPSASVSEADSDNLNQMVIELINVQNGGAEYIGIDGYNNGDMVNGVTITYSSTNKITLSGSASASVYQEILKSLTYSNATDYPSTTIRNITIQGRDVNNNLGNVATVNVEVNQVNDAPIIFESSASLGSTTEDQTSNSLSISSILEQIYYVDVDGGDSRGIAITSTSGNGKWQYSLDNGTTWTNVGLVSESNALLLSSNNYLRYNPDRSNGETANIDFRAWDQSNGSSVGSYSSTTTNGGSTAYSFQTAFAEITVTNANDAPILNVSNPTIATIQANDTNHIGYMVSDFVGESIDDVDTGAKEGIAITSTSGAGTWEYSTDSGTTWTAIGTRDGSSALLLRTSDQVRFIPGNGSGGTTANIQYRAWDQTSGTAGGSGDTTTNGGTTAFSVNTDSASIKILGIYTVTFKDHDGNVLKTETVVEGANATAPTNPTREGHTFTSWDVGYTNVTADTTVTAQYSANEYTVSFNSNGGNAVTDITADYGTTITSPTEPKKEGYTFGGWYKDDTTFQNAWDFTVDTLPVDGITLYAKWTENPTYSVTYNGNGSTGGTVPTDSDNYQQGSSVTVLGNTGNLVKAGYTFAGWNTKADGSGTAYAANATFNMGTVNVTLYAQWNVVSSGGGGGSSTPSQPTTEEITVLIETGGATDGTVVSETSVKRTTDQNGRVKDEVTFTEDRVKETIEKLKEQKQETARIVIPDKEGKVSEVNVKVPKEAVNELVNGEINLEIQTEDVKINIPKTSMENFDEELYFRVIPIKEEDKKKEIEERAKKEEIVQKVTNGMRVSVLGKPMVIETNMQSRPVTLTLPLRDLPTNEEEKQQTLKNLVIFIEHSDGTKELKKGIVTTNPDGTLSVEFGVNKFSTFTIFHMDDFEGNYHEAYIKGFEDSTFKPTHSVTRAEIAAMIARNLGYEDSQNSSTAPFSDVEATHWAAGIVGFVKQEGLMKGDSAGRFTPNASITRAEMAAIVARYKDLNLPTDGSKAFTDISGHWAMKEIAANKEAGILSGYEDGTFRPNGNLTRAEAVKVVNLMFNRGPLHGVSSPTFKDVPATHWAFHLVEEAAQDHFFSPRAEGGENLVK